MRAVLVAAWLLPAAGLTGPRAGCPGQALCAPVLQHDPTPGAPPASGTRTIRVIEWTQLRYDKSAPLETDRGMTLRFAGQTAERTLELPPRPADPAAAPRITATVEVRPIYTRDDEGVRPNDPWTRLGSVTVLAAAPGGGRPTEIELLRFITGYGGPGTFVQDVTCLAPLLHGTRTVRVFVSTFSEKPGWEVMLTLTYDASGIGYRRPRLVEPLFFHRHVIAGPGGQPGHLHATVTIPQGLARPRLRLISSGHSTDGAGANEFVSSPHVVRIDGVEVARWRPWSEAGAALRHLNPFAGRSRVGGGPAGGRQGEPQVWASDYDRAGWSPGLAVDPLLIPLPELSPGPHTIELEVHGIRPSPAGPSDQIGPHGYWVESAIVVADEPLGSGGDAPP